MVQEQRELELSWLAKSFETRVWALEKQKDEQIWQLMLRTMELERLRSSLQLENESLQTISRQNQTTIQSLNQAIDLLHRENEEVKSHLAEDVGSCCDMADVTTRVEREGGVSGDGDKLGVRVICGGCGSTEACVVFLPCRHLCACDACGDDTSLCPICREEKSSSITTLVF
uniref:RING-type domain-containing protein n=1 Tax=Kalanchoe fedtschenkoi TaxID=63787 RepID=A0A7N0UYZ7_KALFE